MKIKNLLLALLALPLFIVACEPDNPVDEVKDPTVAVTAGVATENTIAFTVTSTEADKVAYLVVEGSEVPTASEVLANGTEIEANKSVELTATELKAETEYTIVAAAQNTKAVVKATTTMTTKEAGETPGPGPEPEVEKFVATQIVTDYESYEGLHMYVFELGDKEWNSNGWGADGGTYYSFAIIAASKGNGVLPNGTYSLAETYSANTIAGDYSYRYQMVDGQMANGMEIYKDANVVITDGKIEANIELERDGSIHHVVFEGSLAVDDGGSQNPSEFEATHVADKWYWGGSSNYGYKYMVAGENFSVDVHFQPQNASETAITAGTYTWTTTTMWGYNDFEEFTTRTFTVDGTSVAVDSGKAVVSNEGDEYHIEMTLMGRDGFTYMIEYNGKLNDKGDVGGEDNALVVNTLGEGSYNSSYYFYTFKAEGENFSFNLLVNEYQAKNNQILAGSYTYAPGKSYAGNKDYFYIDSFKLDGVTYKASEASTMSVEGDGSNVVITLNLVMQSGDQFKVTYNGKVGGSVNEGGSTELTKLDTPTVVGMVEGNAATISWNEIAGAKNYTVTLNGTKVDTVETAYIVYQNLEWDSQYSVSVVANPADAAVNAASDAGTATFSIGANPDAGQGGGDGGNTSGEDYTDWNFSAFYDTSSAVITLTSKEDNRVITAKTNELAFAKFYADPTRGNYITDITVDGVATTDVTPDSYIEIRQTQVNISLVINGVTYTGTSNGFSY